MAIGGIGGSGTRLFARYLSELGYDIGDDLNPPLDNLAFTLLFKRRDIREEPSAAFEMLANVFFSQFTEPGLDRAGMIEPVRQKLLAERSQHSTGWLATRLERLTRSRDIAEKPAKRWGWKEPNTHVVIDRLLGMNGDLVYVHVMRHALDMTRVKNQNQLALWGPLFLDREVSIEPRESLAYWCAVHLRLRRLQAKYGERILLVRYEDMVTEPLGPCGLIAGLAGVEGWQAACGRLASQIAPGRHTGVFRRIDPSTFAQSDLDTAASFGYALT